jgi:hypothetical protein
MWQLRSLPVVLAHARLRNAVDSHIELRAVLALIQMAVSHLRVCIEVLDGLLDAALEAHFHRYTSST